MQTVAANLRSGLPATTVIRLATERPAELAEAPQDRRQPRLIAAILPQVLARYGLGAPPATDAQPRQLDLFA